MTEAERLDEEEVSVLVLGTTLIRNRWRIGRWMVIGAAIAALFGFLKPAKYMAWASFIPRGSNESDRSGLASLAGQFGVLVSAGNQSLSPDFYSRLLKSRVLLREIVRDTIAVQEMGGKRISFLDLFEIDEGMTKRREEQGVAKLMDIVSTSFVRTTGVVELNVATRWPSVSLAIVTSLVNGANAFNQRLRQGQAETERKFVEGRLSLAGSDLRAAEDRLENFLKTNRDVGSSPDLSFARDRLQREVNLKQQVFTSLTQSYEEVRLREVRDTPVISIIEPPSVASIPESRGRVLGLFFGLALGAFFGTLEVFALGGIRRRRGEGDPEANDFVAVLGEVKGEMLGSVRWFTRRHHG